MASGVEMRSKRRNWKTPAAERVAAGMEEELREHRDEKQHKITSLLMMELHGHATPAKPQAAAGLRALEHMYRGSGAPWAGEAPTLLAKEHKLQQAAPPPPAKPSQATATRLKSIENLYRELGTPSRGSGRNGSQGAAGGRRMAANDFDDVHSEGWDRPFAARRREGRSGAASVDMTASVAARWEEGDLAMDSKRQAAATEAALKLAGEINAMEGRVTEWETTRQALLAQIREQQDAAHAKCEALQRDVGAANRLLEKHRKVAEDMDARLDQVRGAKDSFDKRLGDLFENSSDNQMHIDAQRLHSERQAKALRVVQAACRGETWHQTCQRLGAAAWAVSRALASLLVSLARPLLARALAWRGAAAEPGETRASGETKAAGETTGVPRS